MSNFMSFGPLYSLSLNLYLELGCSGMAQTSCSFVVDENEKTSDDDKIIYRNEYWSFVLCKRASLDV